MKKIILTIFTLAAFSLQGVAQSFTPSVMVVPFRTEDQSFIEALEASEDSRIAVEKLNDGLRSQGVEPIDITAYSNSTVKSVEYETGATAASADKMLLDQSGTDIYITVDLQRKSSYSGNSVAIAAKAYDRSTGVILVSKVAFSPVFKTEFYDKLCYLAVEKLFKEGFLTELQSAFDEKGSKGNAVMLRIALGDNSSGVMDFAVVNLVQHETPQGRLSDKIREWLRENTVDGQFHPKGSNAELIVYDKVQVPTINSDGYPMYPDEFASNFVSYLKTLGVIAEERIDGNTVYITIY